MRVLCHGIPFFCDDTPVRLYRGAHEIRTIGNYEGAHYRYDPLQETSRELIQRIARDWEPDLLLCWMPEVHPPPLGIEHAPIRTVALVSDWNVFHRVIATNLSRFDIVLCDKPGVGALGNDLVKPQHLFPLYSQISAFHKPYPVTKDIDVLFVGNLNHAAHTTRAHYLERLAKLSNRYRIVITAGVFGEDYGRLLSRARIVFNHSIRGEMNLRVFETLACGSMAMLEADNTEVRDWLEPDREIILYTNEDFEARLTHLIEHPGELTAIAEAGTSRADGFAGENRLDALLEWAMQQPLNPRRFHELPPSEQDYQTLMMYGYSRWSVYHAIEEHLVARLARIAPEDPRVWTAIAQHLLNEYSEAGSESERRVRAIKALTRAYQLCPESAPRALNLASVFRLYGDTEGEARYLEAAIGARSLDGADFLFGTHANAFWSRWTFSEARRCATLDTLHAEAHVRLALLLARTGAGHASEAHIEEAERLDPENAGGVRLRAEIEWASSRRDAAIERMRAWLPKHPLDPEYRRRLCVMLAEQGRAAEAASLDEESVTIARAYHETVA